MLHVDIATLKVISDDAYIFIRCCRNGYKQAEMRPGKPCQRLLEIELLLVQMLETTLFLKVSSIPPSFLMQCRGRG